ncbi:MAG: hypothetical protein ACOCX2_14190 [Armatimonadota bacterium]
MVLLGMVILGSGIVIGSVGTLMVVRKAMVRAVEHPEQMPERATNRMARRYDLTERQQTEVEAILRERLQRMARIRHQMRPRLDAELDSLREEVAAIDLHPERQAALARGHGAAARCDPGADEHPSRAAQRRRDRSTV